MNVIHTEVHWITNEDEIFVANDNNNFVHIYCYSSPDTYADNLPYNEFQLPYEFIEEILRVRKPT